MNDKLRKLISEQKERQPMKCPRCGKTDIDYYEWAYLTSRYYPEVIICYSCAHQEVDLQMKNNPLHIKYWAAFHVDDR